MAAAYFGEGGYGASASVIHADSAHPNHIVVPDAQLLFTAHFHRAGPDLVLTGRDGHNHIVPGYFSGEHRPALAAPNGAMLSPDLVDLLAGSAAPNEYAQAGLVTPADPIGRVEKVVGDVTVVRNGVSVTLNVGDAVYKSDIVQTGANSSAGVAFPDGSALNLVANTRMALSDYSYDPNSTSNSALFNLVEGGLSFVAGKVAHTGDMKIGTPVATMGIRGTAGWLYEDTVANITANAGNVTLHFAAVFDSVTNTESTYTLYALDANGELQHDANGNLIALATVSSTQNGLVTTLTGNGIGNLPGVTTAPPNPEQVIFAQTWVSQAINMAIDALRNLQPNNQPTNPQSNPSSPGSSTPQGTPNNDHSGNPPVQRILDLGNGSPPVIINIDTPPSNSTPPQTTPPQTTPSNTPTGPTTRPWDPPPGSPPQPFNTLPDWPPSAGAGGVPGPTDSIVDNSLVPLVVPDSRTINNLTVGTGALVHVVGSNAPGSLTVSGTTDTGGMIQADSTKADPIVTFDNAVTVHAGGEIQALAQGNSASIIFDSSVTLDAAAGQTAGGKTDANGSGASLTFNDGATIAAGAEIEASGVGANVQFAVGAVDDFGTILAHNSGTIVFSAPLTVEAGGVVEASGSGASVTFNSGVTLAATAEIEASGSGASILFTGAVDEQNSGRLLADGGGALVFSNVEVTNSSTGIIEATGSDSHVTLAHADIIGGTLETGSPTSPTNGEIEVGPGTGSNLSFFDGSTAPVTADAFVQVDDGSSLELLGAINNEGTISLASGAKLILSGATVDGGTIDDNGAIEVTASSTLDGNAVVQGDVGALTVDSGAILTLDDATLENVNVTNDGTLQVDSGHVLTLSDSTIDGGTIVIDSGATLTLDDAVLENVNVINHGTLHIDSDNTLTLSNTTIDGGAITDSGAIVINENSEIGGNTVVQGDVGAVTIDSGKILTLDDATLENLDVNANNAALRVDGTLALDHDTISGGTIDASLGSASAPATEIAVQGYNAIGPAVSANGEFVAFIAATDLPGQGGDTSGLVELYNATNGQLTNISALVPAADLHSGEAFGNVPSISDNGHLVLFEGKYQNENGPTSEVFLYNSQAEPGAQVTSVRSDAGQGAISGNGKVIAAEGNSGESFGTHILVMNDSGAVQTEITGDPTYTPPPDNNSDNFGNVGSVYDPSLSDDGRFVSFWSTSSEITIAGGATFETGNTAGAAQVYVYDTLNQTLKEASGVLGGVQGNGNSGALTLSDENSDWAPSISGNGRFVVFQSTASNLASDVGDAHNDVSNIFLYDTHTGTVVAVTTADGSAVTGNSIRPEISADGKYITFASDANNLPGANGGWQTYMVAINPATGGIDGAPELLSAGFAGTDNGQNNLGNSVSDGGGVAAFGGAALGFNIDQGQAALNEDGTIKFSGASLSDFNGASDSLMLTVSVQQGTLVPAGSHGAGQSSVVFTGNLDAINADLQTGVSYTRNGSNANDTLSLTVTDKTTGETATFTSQFNPETSDPSQVFTGSTTNTGQYDIFLDDQQTINVTGNTTINDGATIEGGLVTVASDVTLTLNGVTDDGSTIQDFGGTVAFTGSSTLKNVDIFGGAITVASGATLTLDDVTLKNVVVTVDGDGTTPSLDIPAGKTLTWAGSSSFGGPDAVIIENDGHIIHAGTLDVGFSQVTFDGAGTVTQDGGNHGTETQTLINNGNTFDGYGQMGNGSAEGGLTIENEAGSFDADVVGKALVLDTGKAIVNDGTFKADGGILKVLDAVTGSGSAIVEHGGTLELGSSDAQTVTFNDASTLVLDHQGQGDPQAYTGTIDGFGSGDVLDLTGFHAGSNDQFQTSASYDGDANTTTLTITDMTQDEESSAPITLAGNYTAANGVGWAAASDGHGGIDLTEGAVPVVSFNPTYLTFSGDGQSAIGSSPSTQTDNVTLAGWVNWNGNGNPFGGNQILFYNGDTGANGYGLLATPNGEGGLELFVIAGGNAIDDTGVAISPGQWNFLALTEVGGTFDLFVNGTEEAPLGGIGVNAITSGGMLIGADNRDPSFNNIETFQGSIADVSVWDTALSQAQIQAIQGTYLSGNETGLAGYYPLSDGSGTTAADSVNSAGNLTLSGNPAWVLDGSHSWPITGGDTPENSPATLVGLNVSESNAADTLEVTLDAGHGTLSIGSASGVTETGSGTDALSLSGTAAAIDAALTGGVTYTPNTGFTGTDDLTFNASDGAITGTPETLAINVPPPPSPPVDTWTGNADGFEWSTNGNWSGGAPPSAGEQAAIPSGDNPAIMSPVTLDNVTLDNGGAAGATVSVVSGAILTLDDNTTITGGTLRIGSDFGDKIAIHSGENGSATLDNVTVDNSGTLQIDNGATLAIADTVTLQDGGTVSMASGSQIAEPSTDTGSIVTLDNVDNTIEGVGTIGRHDDLLVLTNGGTIDANISSGAVLAIDTADDQGHSSTLTNTGTLKAENGGELSVHSIVDNSGGSVVASGGFVDFLLGISSGTATISGGGKLEYGWSSDVSTTFDGSGTLVIDHPSSFHGTISGLTAADILDLGGFNWVDTTAVTGADSYNIATNITLLTVYDSSDSNTQQFKLVGDYSDSGWTVSTDNQGGANVVDPSVATLGESSITFSDGNPPVQLALDAPVVLEEGASLYLTGPGSETVSFGGSFGAFVVDNPSTFTGTVSGISGSGDVLDLGGFGSQHGDAFAISTAYNGSDTILTVTDTSNNSAPESIALAGNYTDDVFTAAYDGSGGADVVGSPAADSTSVMSTATADSVSGVVTFADANSSDNLSMGPDGLNYVGSNSASGQAIDAIGNMSVDFNVDFGNDQINLSPGQTLTQSYDVAIRNTDPSADQSQTVSVTIGGPGNDNFVFAPGVGADTVLNFNPQHDTIELDHFAQAQTVQELQSLITTDAHGDAIINLGHNDSITLANTTTAQLQQAIQAGHVLLH